MKRRLTTLLLLLASAVAAPAFAAGERWYDVELIVFARDSVQDNEVWPELPEMPEVSEARELIPASRSVGEEPFRMLPANRLRLGGAKNRLSGSGFKILKHVAWRQPGLSRDRAVAVHLHSSERGASVRPTTGFGDPITARPKLDGTVRLILSRYLHLEVDLAYREERENGKGNDPEDLLEGAQHTIYRMSDSRRMRSRELHYLDHPKLGIVAVVTPYEGG